MPLKNWPRSIAFTPTATTYQWNPDRGMGAFAAVAQGSEQEPALITLRYRGKGAIGSTLGLVGKAVTFDTGGISIKPAANMEHMTSDMAGAAAVLATVVLAARLNQPLEVIGYLPLAENMPSATAYRPGDVLRMYGGKTVEVLNTDAEGRLVLADALVKAAESQPDLVVDVATLTGHCVVALGDSLTDANISTHDAYCRWPDQLARRLVARASGRPLAVINQGLGGNRILHDLRGESGLRRFDRDVLAQPGVSHAIVMLGTNDLRNRNGKPDEEVTAESMIAGLHQMALRAQARHVKLFAATLTPFGNETFLPGAWTPTRERHRVAFNAWIRESKALDGIVDFDKALRDPQRPTQMLPIYDCGDGLHPSDLGYNHMGDAIDLSLFD